MRKVFLVEDESVIREGFRDKIPWEQYGFQLVGEAGDGEMALPMIRKCKPDLLITDIKMPFMDGLSLSKIVKEEFPKMHIIIISGYDDFEYARQAISIGVDQYLLKPVTRLALRNVMVDLREKFEQEEDQKDYQLRYQEEVREFEQFALRRFFEKILDGSLSASEIYEEAASLSLDLNASKYNLLIFSVMEKTKSQRDWFARKQEEIFHYFLRHPRFILFRVNVNAYGVLIKSDADQMDELIDSSVEAIRKLCEPEENNLQWRVAFGSPVERLSLLPQCFKEANHYYAYRFILPEQHIFSMNTLAGYLEKQMGQHIGEVDFMQMDPEIIRDFLAKGEIKEIHDFVESYLQRITTPLKSTMFRSYVILNIRFAVVAFLDSIGATPDTYDERIEQAVKVTREEDAEIFTYFAGMLRTAMEIRNQINTTQVGKFLKKAMEYIDLNFCNDSLSLGQVSEHIGMSPNYLSAMFSQNMQKTFIEYVTDKRIEKAKKLLRQTEKTSGEIARLVGYKDAHYFSFVFKKLCGMSPREYRAEKRI